MAIGDSYATTAELKTRLGITTSTNDTQLAEALSAASRGVEKFCNRQFNKTTTPTARAFYVGGPRHYVGGPGVEIDDFHTTTGLIIATDDGSTGTYGTTWLTTDYLLEPLNGISDGESGWPYHRIVGGIGARDFPFHYGTPRPLLQVTAQWGWTAVPARVKEATLMSAEELYRLKDAPFGVAGFDTFGAVRVRGNPYVASLLAPYRRDAVLVG